VTVAAEALRSSVEEEWRKFLLTLSHLPAPGLINNKCKHIKLVCNSAHHFCLSCSCPLRAYPSALEKLLEVWFRIEILILVLAMTVYDALQIS